VTRPLVVDIDGTLTDDERMVDTGFAYHVKSPDVSKGRALAAVADRLERDPAEFVAVGDSVNDVSTFDVVGRAFAVANADEAARAAADEVVPGAYADGFFDAIERVEDT
jgi:hydroxymethylpyrimidine pyrophosphatase-like HAD family hydrolase